MPGFLDTINSIFGSGDTLPWTTPDIIQALEREAANDDNKGESYMRLSWALVHSQKPADVQRGLLMLEASLSSSWNKSEPQESLDKTQIREILYLLAVGHFRGGDISRARQYIDEAMALSPDFRQGETLRRMIEEKITRDGAIGIGIAAAAVGILAGGVAALVTKRR